MKISVIIPVYNAQEYLGNCIQSLEAQSFTDWEGILIDDGSTDHSLQLCEEAEKRDPRFHVFHTQNQGAAVARNYGVKKSSGDWIAFLDCDDTIATDYLAYLYENANQISADVSVCGFRKVYQNRASSEKKTDLKPIVFSGKEATEALLYQRYFLSVPWGMISKRTLWEHVQFPEGTKAEDMGTIYRLFLCAAKISYGPRKLYCYYQRKGNTMFTTQKVRNIDYAMHCSAMVEYIKKEEPDLLPAARSRRFAANFQILSETPLRERKTEFIRKIYEEIKQDKGNVMRDKNAKVRNRIAARIACISIPMIHRMVRWDYQRKMQRL